MDILQTYQPYKHQLSSAVLADALDALGHKHSALPPHIRPLRPQWKVFGRVATLNAIPVADEPEHPYLVEMRCIDALKPGDVLVATTNGDQSSALWGELLSTATRARGATAAIIDGLTRDAAQILDMDFPVFASGFFPLDSKGRLDAISHGQPIRIGNLVVQPGDFLFGDIDGVVIIPHQTAPQAFQRAVDKVTGENRVREELAKGRSVEEVFQQYGIL